MSRMRLDQAMVERGLCASRARARDAIKRGYVSVNGQRASKASQMVDEGMRIEEQDPAAAYVSRAALKLLHGLEHFGFDPRDQVCVDIGASTGGFCQVLLERGARMVYGIDVGHDQMHPSLRGNPQLAVLEGINARQLDRSHVPDPFSFLVSDVSFISLRLALPPALLMAEPGSVAILLVKPQFEVGKEGIGKGGLVRDADEGKRAAEAIAKWIDGEEEQAVAGWKSLSLIPSPILGGDGNAEYLLGAVKS